MSTIYDNIAFLPASGAAVWFGPTSYAAYGGGGNTNGQAVAASNPQLTELITELEVAPWGEDNRFPQHISDQLDYCGVAKSALAWKAQALWGQGLYWGKVIDYDDKGNEIFKIAKPGEHPDVEQFMRDNGRLYRYFLEFNLDWVTYANCFPELVFSRDGKKVKRLVHQESCDARFKQMDNRGRIQWVYLSKLWGGISDQFVKFNKNKALAGFKGSTLQPRIVDNKYVLQRRAIDMYNPLEDTKAAVAEGHRNMILPVNFPSTNKTYYQLAYWDGARLSGWLEIAAKIPAMLKAIYKKAFNIKYHIQIPENYWSKRFGAEAWTALKPEEQEEKRRELLAQMDKFLSGEENAHKAFISFFDVDRDGKESGAIKINVIDNKSTVEKDLLASGAANSELLFAMQINPNMIGAGMPGGIYSGNQGGSNIREGFLVYASLLHLERQLILEPLRLIQQYNEWDPDLEWRIKDTVLTTLDTGAGTTKKLS